MKIGITQCFIRLILLAALLGCSTSSNGNTSASLQTGNAAIPSIDCPLRKQGINPHDMRPFEDVQNYINFLERSDRAIWQKPDAVIAALHLTGSEKLADIGAGSGYFSFRFARVLPRGKVYAIDIEPEMLRHIHHKAMTEAINNIEVIKAEPDDPKVPEGVDLVFVCDVIHHVQMRDLWLKKLSAEMKQGTKLAVIEFKEGDLPEGPPASVKIAKDKLITMISEKGFQLDSDLPDVLPYQNFLVFSRL